MGARILRMHWRVDERQPTRVPFGRIVPIESMPPCKTTNNKSDRTGPMSARNQLLLAAREAKSGKAKAE
jgi:hypothetical protein